MSQLAAMGEDVYFVKVCYSGQNPEKYARATDNGGYRTIVTRIGSIDTTRINQPAIITAASNVRLPAH
jgi:hypothetical protein